MKINLVKINQYNEKMEKEKIGKIRTNERKLVKSLQNRT